ncbi:MAG: hypothetical protein ABWZ82_09110, partial [Candidatus Limnocylindrales bacterium]
TAASPDVCDGASVSYTYEVRNNSAGFLWTGDVTDDVLGVVAADVTIGAGATASFTLTGPISGTVTNTATATGAFNDPDDTSAELTSEPVTVTSHACDITVTKTAVTPAVCQGATASYQITVTNESDRFTWTGSVVDDVLGSLATEVTIGPGESVSFTPTHETSDTVTNTVTAAGSFGDPAGTAADGSAQATVTSQACAITVTKIPAAADVCEGSSVGYTITVTNTSELPWTGDVVDDLLGTLADDLTLEPGASQTYTPTGVISGTVTNTVTATGTSGGATVSGTASATVTGRTCAIAVTKVPAAGEVCEGDSVGYTITVTNESETLSWTGSVVDDVLGTLADAVTIGPGASVTYTPTHQIGDTVTNIVTATGAFGDPDGTAAGASAQATVTSVVCEGPASTDGPDGPASTIGPEPTPPGLPPGLSVPAPIIIAKVDTKGTSDRSDDRLLAGARFEIRADDGDGEFETNGDDALVFEGVATRGFLAFNSPPEGVHWVVEVDAPPGYYRARPVEVHYIPEEAIDNCVQIGNRKRCKPDDDGSGGVLLVVIQDSPVDLPRTDSHPGAATDGARDADVPRRRHLGG